MSSIQTSDEYKAHEREQLISLAKFTEDDMRFARELGTILGGNGFTHEQQLKLVANRLREKREHGT